MAAPRARAVDSGESGRRRLGRAYLGGTAATALGGRGSIGRRGRGRGRGGLGLLGRVGGFGFGVLGLGRASAGAPGGGLWRRRWRVGVLDLRRASAAPLGRRVWRVGSEVVVLEEEELAGLLHARQMRRQKRTVGWRHVTILALDVLGDRRLVRPNLVVQRLDGLQYHLGIRRKQERLGDLLGGHGEAAGRRRRGEREGWGIFFPRGGLCAEGKIWIRIDKK
jgi:hypothetical protein